MNDFLDSIDAILAAPTGEVRTAVHAPASYTPKDFSEPCFKCRGTGRFGNYGQCFACQGKGKKTFKTSPEARAKASAAKVNKKLNSIEAFKAANPEVYEWLQNNTNFEFAVSLNNALHQYGDLTDGQLNAAKKCVATLAAKKAERAAQATVAPAIDVSKIETAFATAKGNKIKSPKLNLGSFKFSCAPASGKNAGSIYVKSGESYLGKVTGGKFHRSYSCTTEQEAEVIAAAANPSEAAKAYGFRSGNCSCCGRMLTKGISIDMGIGPICAEKYGW